MMGNREDGTGRTVDVDIAGTIQWVESQQIVTAWIAVRDRIMFIHLFRGNACQQAGALHGIDEDLIGDDIQLLLLFALHIFLPGRAQNARQFSQSDQVRQALARGRDIVEQRREGTTRFVLRAALLDNVLGKCRAYLAHQISTMSKSSFTAPQSGQLQFRGTSSHKVPGAMPSSGQPCSSS